MDNFAKLAQFGIAVSVLGAVLTFMGLFPSVVGLEASAGTGLVQMLTILVGFTMLIGGAYIFAWAAYFPGLPQNLAQSVAVRLSMTGLVLGTVIGLADVLGFGSNPPIPPVQRPLIGPVQSIGIVGAFLIASSGVLIFVLFGPSDHHTDD